MLPAGSALAGTPWKPERAPWIAEICAAIADPLVDQVSVIMGTQMSKTEGAQLSPMGWILEDRPAPIMYIGPTQSLVNKIAQPKGRFDQMIEGVPELAARVDLRDQRTYQRYIAGVQVHFGWAGSESETASSAVKYCFVDEYDKMPADVLGAAESRVKTFFGGTVVVVSTPTLDGASNIQTVFDEGTRERWHLQCPHCAEWFYPRIELLRWPKGARGLELRRAARLVCPACGGELTDKDRRAAPARYFPTEKADAAEGGEHQADQRLDIRPALSHRSFAVSGIFTWAQTIGVTAEKIAKALRSLDPLRIQRAVNEQGGEAYRLRGDSPGWKAVWALRESYGGAGTARRAPPAAQFVTVGADPAADRIDYVVRAWGYQAESWLLEEGILRGDTLLDQVFLDLQGVCNRDWGAPVKICLCDSGYRAQAVYAASRREPLLFPSKGNRTGDRRFWDVFVDRLPDGRALKVGVRMWHINVGHWAEWLYGRIRWTQGEAGAWHVHDQISESYARQVTNEEAVPLATGGVAWVTTGDRQNHKGDCERLAAAGAYICNVEGIPAPAPPPAPRAPRRRSGDFDFRS